MNAAGSPQFSELSEEESRLLLARNHVGRLAFSLHDRTEIQPVHYVFDDGWLFGRTQIGSMLVMLLHHPFCAFEVDEVRDIFDWDSVVVHGAFSVIDPEITSPDRYERALAKLRELIPAALSASDPVPDRMILFGVYVSEIAGRSARPSKSLE
jgi:nitroimidazol reductase NimA-like FMN-containing flavoprotein (pyridoxamine 5'-phosphate oxidase superfamily)